MTAAKDLSQDMPIQLLWPTKFQQWKERKIYYVFLIRGVLLNGQAIGVTCKFFP